MDLPAREPDAVIAADGLSKKFGSSYAVRDVTFEVPHGSIFGYVGPSGSGKSTTVRLLTGVYSPSSGQVFVLGQAPRSFTRRTRERIGYMPQLFALYPDLTVRQNLDFVASMYGMGLGRRKRISQVLDFVELQEHRHKLARRISGGMQRRLSLAATLVHDPELVFLDEPTAGIDPVLRRKFWGHFRDLKEQGHTLFVTTQYISEVENCDVVAVMTEGRLLALDSPAGLRHVAYGGDLVDMRTVDVLDVATVRQMGALEFMRGPIVRRGDTGLRLVVEQAGTAVPAMLEWSRSRGIAVESIERFVPPFEDVFVELLARGDGPGSISAKRSREVLLPPDDQLSCDHLR